MTTGTINLTMQTFVAKVISLLFNTLSRFVLVSLLRSKRLLNSWLQSLSTVILEPKKIKSVTVSIVSPSICHEPMEWVCNQDIGQILSSEALTGAEWSDSKLTQVAVAKSPPLRISPHVFTTRQLISLVISDGRKKAWIGSLVLFMTEFLKASPLQFFAGNADHHGRELYQQVASLGTIWNAGTTEIIFWGD